MFHDVVFRVFVCAGVDDDVGAVQLHRRLRQVLRIVPAVAHDAMLMMDGAIGSVILVAVHMHSSVVVAEVGAKV